MAGEENQHRRRHGEATVVIIGGGISGICVAIDLLKRNNCRDFVILEKSAGVGGTWYVLFKYTSSIPSLLDLPKAADILLHPG